MLQKVKNFPIGVKITQIIFILAIAVYGVMLLGDIAPSFSYVAMAVFLLGNLAAALSITHYKSGSWPLGIIDFIVAISLYIHYLTIAKTM